MIRPSRINAPLTTAAAPLIAEKNDDQERRHASDERRDRKSATDEQPDDDAQDGRVDVERSRGCPTPSTYPRAPAAIVTAA